MRTLFIYLVLVLWAGVSQAQKITELKEAKVGFAPLSSEVIRDGDSFSYKVNEAYQGEFENDALGFMNAYFDINNFMTEVKDENYDSYQVSFISKKGHLIANFDKHGNLETTSERFRNILLPANLREEIYKDHNGWTMIKNVHLTQGKSGVLNKDIYRIKLENGKSRKIVKIDVLSAERNEVASN